MSYTTTTILTCDFCGRQEKFEKFDIDYILFQLPMKGWKHYEDTNKQYCSRTCSANHRK